MQPSPELEELTNRIAKAIGQGDVAFLERHVSRQADVAFLGTDPDEWWTDMSGLSQALAAQAVDRAVVDRRLLYAARLTGPSSRSPLRYAAHSSRETGRWFQGPR
jgi:hypothetical protein